MREADVTVAAAPHRLGNRVEWVHVFETPAIAGMLRGGEFLLTTGIALAGMPAGEVDALVAGAARSGAAGIGFEPSHAPVDALAAACRRHELPLLVFGTAGAVRRHHARRPGAAGGERAGDAAAGGLAAGAAPRGGTRGARPGRAWWRRWATR